MYPYLSFAYPSFIYPYSSINPFTLFLLPLSTLSLFRSLARPLPFSLTGRSLSLSLSNYVSLFFPLSLSLSLYGPPFLWVRFLVRLPPS